MAIQEENLVALIKELKKNGYRVTRSGDSPSEEGFARGSMSIRYQDRQRFGVVTDIDLNTPIDHEKELRKIFGL